jgi:cytochrome c oxidase cbb3-type subunit 2
MLNARIAALLAGAGIIVLVLISHAGRATNDPASGSSHRPPPVTSVVRNDLGELKWMATEATDYTPTELAGRDVYLRSGCAYCHSQYVRPATAEMPAWGPVSADARRWGPPVEPSEYAYDGPRLPGSRLFGIGIRIAPDLSREGLKYSDEWHLAHFWNPPMMTQGSIMGGFSGLFDAPADPVAIVNDAAGARTLQQTAVTEKLFAFTSKQQVKLTPNDQGLLFVPLPAQGKYPLIWTPNKEYTGNTVKLVAETNEIHALIAFLQKLGMSRGRWRELYQPPDEAAESTINMPRSEATIAHGKAVYERRCIACHGVNGDGNGAAATFLYNQRPRNFTLGEFKFRLTKGPLPTDQDLLRTISRGVRGTAMPAWFELPLEDRLAVIQYIKYVLAVDRSDPRQPDFYFVDEPPGVPLSIGTPPPPSTALIAHGGEIWRQAKCWECHGNGGKGDGEKAAGLQDDWGFPIRPANLSSGEFKSGPRVTDIYRTISTGLTGTPMPSFHDAFPDADRWALAYYILSLSAFNDPLTAAPLPIAAPDRTAIDDPKLETPGPERAYGLRSNELLANARFGK